MSQVTLKPGSIPWLVVVVGRWNRAILTPLGISEKLFHLPKGTELQVLVPLDAIAPLKVSYQDLSVLVDGERVVIEPRVNSYPLLGRGMELGLTALNALPMTPVSAAGFNLAFEADASTGVLNHLFHADWDGRLEETGYPVASRESGRTCAWRDGDINLRIVQKSGEPYTIFLNFNRTSSSATELMNWLQTKVEDVQGEVDKILKTLLGAEDVYE